MVDLLLKSQQPLKVSYPLKWDTCLRRLILVWRLPHLQSGDTVLLKCPNFEILPRVTSLSAGLWDPSPSLHHLPSAFPHFMPPLDVKDGAFQKNSYSLMVLEQNQTTKQKQKIKSKRTARPAGLQRALVTPQIRNSSSELWTTTNSAAVGEDAGSCIRDL